MPIIKSAIKKVRKDKTRTARNKRRKILLKSLVGKARINKTAKDLQVAFSALDKAAKVHLIHPNKAARLKSRLSKSSKNISQTPTKLSKIPVAKKNLPQSSLT